MYVVLLGPPGAGKGTQAKLLAQRLQLGHISSGDLFRETAKSGSAIGLEIAAIMARGDLVPDELTVQMVIERLRQPDCANGVILDGFPRTMPQAKALDAALGAHGRRIDRAVSIEVPDDVLVRRLSSRWISRNTGETFNIETLDQSIEDIKRGLDPDDELYQRADDTPETARARIGVYNRNTLPLIEYYRQQQVLRSVDGNRDIDAVQRDLVAAIESP